MTFQCIALLSVLFYCAELLYFAELCLYFCQFCLCGIWKLVLYLGSIFLVLLIINYSRAIYIRQIHLWFDLYMKNDSSCSSARMHMEHSIWEFKNLKCHKSVKILWMNVIHSRIVFGSMIDKSHYVTIEKCDIKYWLHKFEEKENMFALLPNIWSFKYIICNCIWCNE